MSTTPPPAKGASQTSRFTQVSATVAGGVLELGLVAMCFVMEGLTNLASHDEFDELLEHTLSEIEDAAGGSHDTRADPILAGYRDLHGRLNRSNRDHVSASENLFRLVKMNGSVPRTNLLADIHTLVSVKTRLAISVHDLAHIEGNVRLCITTGKERLLVAHAREPTVVLAGEYAYIDDADDVIWRMETKQAAKTKVSLATTATLCLVQGNKATDPEYVAAAAGELIALTKEFCGGRERILFGPY